MLLEEATEKLLGINGLEIVGTAKEKSGIISFILTCPDTRGRGVHPHDIATILSEDNIAIRAGHHCTQPIMDFYDIAGTARASFSIYNSLEDVQNLVKSINNVKNILRS